MSVSVIMADLAYCRYRFEKFLEHNHLSTTKYENGDYVFKNIQNMWVAYRNGFRSGVESTGKECEF